MLLSPLSVVQVCVCTCQWQWCCCTNVVNVVTKFICNHNLKMHTAAFMQSQHSAHCKTHNTPKMNTAEWNLHKGTPGARNLVPSQITFSPIYKCRLHIFCFGNENNPSSDTQFTNYILKLLDLVYIVLHCILGKDSIKKKKILVWGGHPVPSPS